VTRAGETDAVDMNTSLVRIETKLDMALGRVEDHEGRLRQIERAIWRAAGVAAAIGGTIGVAAAAVLPVR